MRITERRLRKVIKNIIRETTDSSSNMLGSMTGSWEDLASSRPSPQQVNPILDRILSDLDDELGTLDHEEILTVEETVSDEMAAGNRDYSTIYSAVLQSLNILTP